MKARFDSLLPDVLPEVDTCPDFTAEKELRRAAIEFCDLSGILRKKSDPINVVANKSSYQAQSISESMVLGIIRVKYNGVMIFPITEDKLDTENPGWESVTGSQPTHYILTDTRTIRLYPIPTEALTRGLVIESTYRPKRDADGMDDLILDEYADTLVSGALYRLFSMSSKPWADRNEARRHEIIFRRGISEARAFVSRGYSNEPASIKPVAFGFGG